MLLPNTVQLELIGEVPIYVGLGIQISTAMVLGGLVGLDRERKMKTAGMKTNMLICIGAALYTAISLLMSKTSGSINADPNRTAAQIVSGIGFLGAGAIIQSKGAVKGLTTAATVWVVAAIGMTVGAGYPVVASVFTLTTLSVLKLMNPLLGFLEKEKDFKTYHLEVLSTGSVGPELKEIIFKETPFLYEMSEESLDEENNRFILHLYISLHPRRIRNLVGELKSLIKIDKINYFVTEKEEFSEDFR